VGCLALQGLRARCDEGRAPQPRASHIGKDEEPILAADCGGTTTRLMLYAVDPRAPVAEKQTAPGHIIFEEKYPNILFKSFNDIVKTFFHDVSLAVGEDVPRPLVAVLAIAGIVTRNQCRYTNLDWVVTGDELSKEFGIKRVEIINDFVAQGYGVLTLADSEVIALHDAPERKGAPIAVVGAGTGLGTCFLTVGSTGHYEAYPSEGGHIEFAPRGQGSNDLQIELLKFLKVRLSGWNRISIERVVSGRGICNVYEFLSYQYPDRVVKDVHREFMQRPTDAGIIARNAWPGSLCEQALQIFASCYGAQVGSTAIFLMPFRGVYLTGGVTHKLADWMQRDGSFLEAYRDKGRVTPMLSSIPLLLVRGENMGQRGAHLRAVRLLKEFREGAAPLETGPSEPVQELVAPRDLDVDGIGAQIAKLISDYRQTHDDKDDARAPPSLP